MPIYAFECDACGHQFDRLQRLADADPAHCPECGEEQVRRQLTAPSFRLSGAGWYETDFKKDGDKKRNLADKPDSKPSDTASPAATESQASSDPKPVAKVDSKPEKKAGPTPAPAAKPPVSGASGS